MRLLIIANHELHANRRLVQEGRKAGHRVRVAKMEDLEFVVRGKRRTVRLGGTDVLKAFDVIYLRYFYPYIPEALLLAEWAVERGLGVVDRVLAERNFVQSKVYDSWKLAEAGLPVPGGVQVMRLGKALAAMKSARWPQVAKGVHGARGRYVFKIKDLAEARRHLKGEMTGFFTFQDYLDIEAEYRVIVIGGRALGAMRKNGPKDDFRHNLSVGAEGEKAELPRRLLRLCERAARLLGREFAGIDLAIAGGKPYILEVNRRPGYEGFEEATGLNVARAFVHYVVRKHNS
jgi:RimK family alpha-L-glutamate ligase